MNILWKHKTTGAMALTSIADKRDPEKHAAELLERGDVPKDYAPVGYALAELPHHWPIEVWEHKDGGVGLHVEKARRWHKDRLRRERAPALDALDVRSLRNQEAGADNAATLKAKQTLRDLPTKVDDLTDWAAMSAVTVPQEVP